MATWDDPSGTFSDQSGNWTPTGNLGGFGGYGGGSGWFSSDPSGTFSDPTGGGGGGGGFNWAGLSQGLGKLSDALKSGSGTTTNPMQGSSSVVSTVSGGTPSPKEAGYGASALASADTSRQQLAQYLLLSAMQGKGRGRSGQGLLG
jgi:hypothetical protein